MQGMFSFTLEEREHQHEIKTPIMVVNAETNDYVKCDAIWDTGATSSMIAASVASQLQLRPCGSTTIAGVHGVHDANCYIVNIKFNNGIVIRDIKVSEASNTGGFGLLVGMDIIGRGILYINGLDDCLAVRFDIPVQ